MSENHPESIPGCAGEWGAPRPPSGPCEKCAIKNLCKKLTNAKKAFNDILDVVVEVRNELKGEASV
jgi:hypothetical protein